MREKLTIQDWAASERPREKFLERGARSLSDAELLAILINSGNRQENAVELARKILAGAGNNLLLLRKFTFNDFKKFKGIGIGKAISVMAAFELAARCDMAQTPVMARIHSSEAAATTLVPILRDLPTEECWVLYLNSADQLIWKERISSGGIDTTVVDVRIIIKNALERNSSHIILAHNHPSGSLRPGKADMAVTKKLKEAARLCDIQLLDHIIVGGNSYFSFADEGVL